MSDRLFADCCYGTDWQHAEHAPCPWIEHATYILDTGMLIAGPRAVAAYLREHFVPAEPGIAQDPSPLNQDSSNG